MAKDFSKHIYYSKKWKKTRDYIYKKFYGLCGECGNPGEEVHHIQELTPNNINDMDIVYGEKNLILLCRECHFKKHRGRIKSKCTREGLKFNENGELVKA